MGKLFSERHGLKKRRTCMFGKETDYERHVKEALLSYANYSRDYTVAYAYTTSSGAEYITARVRHRDNE